MLLNHGMHAAYTHVRIHDVAQANHKAGEIPALLP